MLARPRRRTGLDRRHPRGHRRLRPAGEGRRRPDRLSRDDGRPGQDPAPGRPRRPARRARRRRPRQGHDRPRHRRASISSGSTSIRSRARSRPAATSTPCVENIDIGGPAMIRSAAKNHGYVAVCVDPADGRRGAGRAEGRRHDDPGPAQDAWPPAPSPAPPPMTPPSPAGSPVSSSDAAPARKIHRRHAGPDPALRREPAPDRRPSTAPARPGPASPTPTSCRARNWATTTSPTPTPPMSWSPSSSAPACVIVKHANPCGVAIGGDLSEAYAARAGMRRRLGLRRRHRRQPPAERGRRPTPSPTSSPRSSSRPAPTTRPAPSSPPRRTCAC